MVKQGKADKNNQSCGLTPKTKQNPPQKKENPRRIKLSLLLAHIGKTRMQKLQREGHLESINDESYEKCESCISGKMTKNPFNKTIERATDLLFGLSTYRCVWTLRQRVKERVNKNGIVQHFPLTSPYTPTKSKMVYLKDYALESVVRILNMVPTKKVKRDSADKNSNRDLFSVSCKDNPKELKDLGKLHTFWNQIYRENSLAPMEVKHELSNEMCASTPEEVAYMKKVPYASAVGSIMYAVRCHRPDVTFAQNLYLRNTRDMFLVYRGKPDAELNVTGFCDASWQCDKDDMNQHEAEYMAASRNCRRRLLLDYEILLEILWE
ncbi:hypothetical protein Tco_0073191 [Tanacetum coccineum]